MTFSHHSQGIIDFNTVSIQRTIGMYFLVLTVPGIENKLASFEATLVQNYD